MLFEISVNIFNVTQRFVFTVNIFFINMLTAWLIYCYIMHNAQQLNDPKTGFLSFKQNIFYFSFIIITSLHLLFSAKPQLATRQTLISDQ